MSSRPGAQNIQIFESAVKQEEEPLNDIPVRIEIDVRSLSSFVKNQPDTLEKMWDQVQNGNINEDSILSGDELNNFLHDILKKWYEFHSPREESKLVKAQTTSAVGEFKKLISSSRGDSREVDVHKMVLSKNQLMQFVEQMKQKSFDREDVSVTTAFQTLVGKVFEPSDSGSAIPSAKEGGVEILYRNFKNHLMETPIQKYRRLKSEVNSFQDSLRVLADKKVELNSMSGMGSASDANNDLGKLSELLMATSGELPEDSRQSSFAHSDLLFRNLSSRFEEASNQGAGEPPVFSLFSKGSLDGEQTTMIEKLETRLTNLEKISGASSEAIYTDDAMSLIEYLSMRLNVLGDPAKILSLEQKVSKLNEELEQIKANTQTSSKRVQPILARHRIAKVETMFEMMSTWDKAAVQLPIVIDRLKNLQQLNMEATGVVGQVNALRAQQTSLSQTLSEDRRLLQSLSERLVSSTEKIRENVKSLDERILRLKSS